MIKRYYGPLMIVLAGLSVAVSNLFANNVIANEAINMERWVPGAQDIAYVETHLVMPEGSKPLHSYVRYYYGYTTLGRRFLVGEFVLEEGRSGVRVVSQTKIPKILDGGCSVINLKYSVEQHKVITLFCNGAG